MYIRNTHRIPSIKRETMYMQRNAEVRLRNNSCRGKVKSIKYCCVCVCVCSCGYTGAGLCLRSCSLHNPSCNAPSYVASLAPPNSSTLSHKRHDFRKKSCGTQNVSFDFLRDFYLKHFSFYDEFSEVCRNVFM